MFLARCLFIAALSLPLLLPAAAEGVSDQGARLTGASLAEALEALRREGLKILFSSDLVLPEMKVVTEPRVAAPRQILDEILAPHGLAARAGPGDVLLVVRREPEIRGTVREASSGEPLAGVQILVRGTDIDVRSGADGSFRLSPLAAGTYTLEARMPGFVVEQKEEISAEPGRVVEVVFELVPAPVSLDTIVVTPSRYTILRQEPESRQFLSRDEVNRIPHLADDLYRAVTWLPGTASSGISAAFNIRGGEEEEVLILLDGLEIYEPFHMKDFQSIFSIVDARAVDGVDVLTGSFPAEYGDRMSGVIDITSLTPSRPGRTTLGVSFINAGALSGGGFAGERGNWLLSARRGYLDLVLDWIDPDSDFKPVYYDTLGRVEYRLDEATVLSGNVLAADDDLNFDSGDGEERAEASYRDLYAWLGLEWAPTARLHGETVVSLGSARRDRQGMVEDEGSHSSRVTDERLFDVYGLKQDWSWQLGRSHLLKWGFAGRHLQADYDYDSTTLVFDPLARELGVPDVIDKRVDLRPSGSRYGAYVADRARLSSPLTLEVGLRWDRQTYTGDDDQISPRLNLAHAVSQNTTLRLGWGLFHQSEGIHELQVQDGVETFSPAQRSEHRLIGVEHVLGKRLDLRAEAYQKRISHVRPRYENLFNPVELLPEAEPDRVLVAPQRAEARGLELLLKRRGRRSSWWVSYALAAAEDEIDGDTVPRSWDQTHTVNFSVNHAVGERWNLNLAGTYHTGWPTTGLSVERVENPDGTQELVPVLGPRNGERFPPYHRLDLRASRRVTLRRGTLTFFLEVINLLDRDNVCCIEGFFLVSRPDGSVGVEREEEFWLPLIPSFGVSWEF